MNAKRTQLLLLGMVLILILTQALLGSVRAPTVAELWQNIWR